MAKYLINVTETYRVDTEAEAAKIIEEAKEPIGSATIEYNTDGSAF